MILVDDSPEDALFARRAILASAPEVEVLVVDRARDVEAHLERILDRGPAPDLVLLDLKMPALDGHDVLRLIRARCGPGELPVVVFTSSLEPTDLVRAYAAGANSYVRKPVVFEEFRDAVSEVVGYWTRRNRRVPEDAA